MRVFWKYLGPLYPLAVRDEEIGQASCILDPGILRAKFWSSAVAPPEYDVVGPEPVRANGTSLDPMYECDLLLESGCKCDARFATYKSLRAHQMKSHGVRNTARLAIVTNQCPVCSSTFKSEACAKQHLQCAMVHHRCYADRSAVQIPVRQPAELTCPFCHIDPLPRLAQLQRHICQRLPLSISHHIDLHYEPIGRCEADDGCGPAQGNSTPARPRQRP